MAKNVKINSVIYAEVPQVSIPLAEGRAARSFMIPLALRPLPAIS